MWAKIKAIDGQKTTIISTLKQDNLVINIFHEIANTLAAQIAENFSDKNYNQKFLKYKMDKEENSGNKLSQPINENVNDSINTEISLYELKVALNRNKNTSFGPDKIPNILINELPDEAIPYGPNIYFPTYDMRLLLCQYSNPG